MPITSQSVKSFFEEESETGRRLLPNKEKVSGYGTYLKYEYAVSCIAESNNIKVLDIGCNRGSVEYLFHQLHPEKITEKYIQGLDISYSALKQARSLELSNCNWNLFNGTDFPFPSECFDLIIIIEVLEHVVEKEKFLYEVNRVLKQGGHVFLTTPNSENIFLILEELLRNIPIKDEFITCDKLQVIVDKLRLSNLDNKSMFSWPHLFFHVDGWSILPLLSPNWLFMYQKYCMEKLKPEKLPKWISRRIFWSLHVFLEKNLNCP